MAICTMSFNPMTGGSRPHRRAGENSWRRGRHLEALGVALEHFLVVAIRGFHWELFGCRFHPLVALWNCVIGIIHLGIFLEAKEVIRSRLPVDWPRQLHW